MVPILTRISTASPEPIEAAIRNARNAVLKDKTAEFLATRFGSRSLATSIMNAHQEDEQRPIETVWDAVVGATAYARLIPHQDERVKVERTAGELLKLAA